MGINGASGDIAGQAASAQAEAANSFNEAFDIQRETSMMALANQTRSTAWSTMFQAARAAIQNMGRS